MSESIEEINKIVEKLNYPIGQVFEKEDFIPSFFSFSNGDQVLIQFEEIVLWSSMDDSREFDKELNKYEDLESYVKKQFNNLVTNLNKIKFE